MSSLAASQTIECELDFLASYSALNTLSTQPTFMLDLKEVQAVDPARIRAAAEGVAREWRLFAGRAHVEGAPVTARRTVRVPLGKLPAGYALVNFSSQAHDTRCSVQPPTRSARSCAALPGLTRELSSNFATTKCAFDGIAAAGDPLVAILVSTFPDYQVVGFSFTHGIWDAKAIGMYFRAFSAELNGERWSPPPIDASSRANAAFANVRAQLKDEPAAQVEACLQPGGISEGMVDITPAFLVKLVPALMWDKLWHGAEQAGAFIGADVAAWLVDKIKNEVRASTGGREYVSSYDIMTAWFVKATYSSEIAPRTIWFSGAYCAREMLSNASGVSLVEPELPMCTVALYNQYLPCPSKTSLAGLAPFHRRTLIKQRTIEQVSSSHQVFVDAHAAGKTAPLILASGPNALVVSNESDTGITDSINWGHGSGKKQYAVVNLREGDDRIALLNKMDGGWSWTCTMRPARWAAVRTQLRKLQSEFEAGEVDI